MITLGLCLAGAWSYAAEGEKGDKKETTPPVRPRSKLMEKYDKNNDGKLDEAEREAIKKDREAEMVKKYDKNGDGKLDDTEKAAIREEMRKQREEAARKRTPDTAPKKDEPKKDAPAPK
jgi:hypothetical protein